MSPETASKTLDFYAPCTDPDGPAMTDVVHAIDAAAIGEPGCLTNTYFNRSIRPFVREPFAQFSEARGERAGEGAGAPELNFLTGAGGFTQVFTHGLTGLRWRADGIALDPMLPPQLPHGVELTELRWRGRTFDVRVGPEASTVALRDGEPFTVHSPDGAHVVSDGAPLVLKTRAGRTCTRRTTSRGARSRRPTRRSRASTPRPRSTATPRSPGRWMRASVR